MHSTAISALDYPSEPALTVAPSDLDLFHTCWRLTNCDACLGSPHPCSWCSVSQTCVPNSHSYVPILAPIRNANICPLGWRERWEIRAKPFSCRCSTLTLMSVVISFLSTLTAILAIWVLQKVGTWAWRRWNKRQPGWWRVDGRKWMRKSRVCGRRNGNEQQTTVPEDAQEEERRPLLV